MKINKFIFVLFSCWTVTLIAQNVNSIISGIPWFDQNGNIISAHGAGIIKDGKKYYLFGEYKQDESNAFNGFSCYSSTDLRKWKFEKIVLPIQSDGKLGPERVGERPKVMKCPATGEYIMYMHTDNMQYKDQCVGFATSKTVNGIYHFQGALPFEGQPVKLWDMGVFQDDDGKGYLITHSGNLFELSEDYKSIVRQVVKNMTRACEAPAIFKKDSLYYWVGSDLSGWERNDNYYFTAPKLEGPWTSHGIIAPKGKLTWNSQSTFVLPVVGKNATTYLFMGDRWSNPKQQSAATYIWQPLEINGYNISMPDYIQSWNVDVKSGKWKKSVITGKYIENSDHSIEYSGKWENILNEKGEQIKRSDENGASFSVRFSGTQIGIFSTAKNDGGYAKVEIKDLYGKVKFSNIIDLYCLYPETSLKYLSPKMKKGKYILSVTVLGEHWFWVEKSGRESGSKGNYVSVNNIIVK